MAKEFNLIDWILKANKTMSPEEITKTLHNLLKTLHPDTVFFDESGVLRPLPTEKDKCTCGKDVEDCPDAYSHVTQGY